MKRKYSVSNMMCAACVSHVKKSAESIDGVELVEVNLLTETMNVIYNENITSDQEIMQKVTKEGYPCKIFKREIKKTEESDLKKSRIKIYISAVFMILLMYVAMAPMLKLYLPFDLKADKNLLYFALLQITLLIPIVILNFHYFTSGYTKLFTLKPNMDSLISIGATASIGYGIYVTIMLFIYTIQNNVEMLSVYHHSLYFESAGTILTLITIGKYLESRSKKKTTESLEKIMALAPKVALVERNGEIEEIPQENVSINDIVIVKVGMVVPVDGIIIEGSGSLNESIITGESVPVDKTTHDKVIAGSKNVSGYFKMKATSINGETTIDRILDLVEEAASSKAPIARLADKISAVFVPVVILIALISAVIWLIVGDKSMALNTFISVLVISCPCALGLATPVAIMVSTGKAAENGILIKSAESLELSHKIKKLYLDKTGTITTGKMKVQLVDTSLDEHVFNDYLYTIESLSTHPLSSAVVNYALEKGAKENKGDTIELIPGKGLMTIYQNIKYYAGNAELMKDLGINIDTEKETKLSMQGLTIIYFAKESTYLGMVGIEDEIRNTSYEAIKLLKYHNIEPIMVTGDNNFTANSIAERIGIEKVYAKVTPKEKAEIIANSKEDSTVAFVGDGVNDAVALTSSDIGIAIGTGSDVAVSSADVILPSNDLREVVTLVELSKKTINNIKLNLFWAFFYNAVGIVIATGIFYPIWGLKLNPMIGSLAMSFSSFSVVTNALRLRFFKRKELK